MKKIYCLFALFLTLICLSPITSNSANLSQNITTVTLTPSYTRPASLDNECTSYIKGIGSGEYIEIKITGSLTNLRLVKVAFDNISGSLYEESDLVSLKQLNSQTIVIETYHNCGIPVEKLTWTAPSGETNSYTIAENGNGDLTPLTYAYSY